MLKVSQVTKDDCRLVAQLINVLKDVDVKLHGSGDICAASDAIRWLQGMAVEMAKDFQDQSKPPATETQPPPAAPPTGGLPAGVKIKDFKTGKK